LTQQFTVCRGSVKPGQSLHAYLRQGIPFESQYEASMFICKDVQGFIDFYESYGYPEEKETLEYKLYEDGLLKETLNFRMDGKLLDRINVR